MRTVPGLSTAPQPCGVPKDPISTHGAPLGPGRAAAPQTPTVVCSPKGSDGKAPSSPLLQEQALRRLQNQKLNEGLRKVLLGTEPRLLLYIMLPCSQNRPKFTSSGPDTALSNLSPVSFPCAMPRPGKSRHTGDLDRLARSAVQHPALCQQPLAQLLEVLGHTRNNSLVSACPVAAPSPSPATDSGDGPSLYPASSSTSSRHRARKRSPLGLQYLHHGGYFPETTPSCSSLQLQRATTAFSL